MKERKEIEELVSEYDRCKLECDGLTRVLHTVLTRADIPHTVWLGSISHLLDDQHFAPHFWLTIDETVVDYRCQMWLGEKSDIPHGVFSPTDYPNVVYEGNPIELPILDDTLFQAMIADWDFPLDLST
jgi:hypothetical protein